MDPKRDDGDKRPTFNQAFNAALKKRTGLPHPDDLSSFVRQYASDQRHVDQLTLTPEDAANLALDLLEAGRTAASEDRRIIRIRPTKAGNDISETWVAEIVGPDIAFLLDSSVAACQERRVPVHAVKHPVSQIDGRPFSFIQIFIPALDTAKRKGLLNALSEAISDVELANHDFFSMREKMLAAAETLSTIAPRINTFDEEKLEACAFLNWLVEDHFTFLGVRDYVFARDDQGRLTEGEPIPVEGSELGILRDTTRSVLSRRAEPTTLTEQVREFLNEPSALIVAKASFISRVHRRTHADYIGVKRYDHSGNVIGETRFVGLFTSEAYSQSVDLIPLIRRKVDRVRAMHPKDSRFSIKTLNSVLQAYPRDELFQISEPELFRIAEGILQLRMCTDTALFIRRDRFDRYVSALIFCSRDSYNSERRAKAHTLLAKSYGGRSSAFYPAFTDGGLARVHLIIGLDSPHPEPDETDLQNEVRKIFDRWEDKLEQAALVDGPASEEISGFHFTDAYKEAFQPIEALADIRTITAMPRDQQLLARFCGETSRPGEWQIRIYHRDSPVPLTSIVPLLENLGFAVQSEVGHPVKITEIDQTHKQTIHIHHVTALTSSVAAAADSHIEKAIEAVWRGDTENDAFNSLVPQLAIDWRLAALLRTVCRFRSQSGLDPSEAIQIRSLREHKTITSDLIRLFESKFDPDEYLDLNQRQERVTELEASILKSLETVPSIETDRCLRRILSVLIAAVRTNFYLLNAVGERERFISIKIRSADAGPLPAPQPLFETFVWSPEVEGVHLRFGPVARGGIRWSDRREDFRTEVLGLVKAQQVKNAVIVPVGAKGGFFPKLAHPNLGRPRYQEKGAEAYRQFISALLQITDNIQNDATIRDKRLIAWDSDDPYLVVAADKGTSTFSDTANRLAQEHGFWLDDAFASGGSAGYDHKKMGITARGAWEAVKRHFREMGRDPLTEPISVIGIGDMSGDVFGNGLLLSRSMRVLAAFNHQHIFVDPNPEDLERSWTERKRLFDLPRSTWADYDRSLLSRGGAIFDRTAKSIPISQEVAQLASITTPTSSPDELIRALLEAEVDLLWFGGIGTFVKASHETHSSVSDKSNDAIRVDANRMRAKVVAEGANLGLTQAARVEFARRGGRINTDAIDNSAGVDCSDHEVNIKILLADCIRRGGISRYARNELLSEMTEEVADLVLRNNYDQTLALSLLERSAADDIENHERFIKRMEGSGRLRRDLEGLPSSEAMEDLKRKRMGLTRPELAVLMAYAKMDLFEALIRSSAPDDPGFESLLKRYFPTALQGFSSSLAGHRLRREIIATLLSNRFVNLTGPGFVSETIDYEGRDATRMAQALEAALRVFRLDELTDRINAEDGRIPAVAQFEMLTETSSNLKFLANVFGSCPHLKEGGSVQDLVDRYASTVQEMSPYLPDVLSPFVLARVRTREAAYIKLGSPADLARDVALIRALASCCEVKDISIKTGWPLKSVAKLHHDIGSSFRIDELRAAARDASASNEWERIAIQKVAEELPRQQAELTASVISSVGRASDPKQPETSIVFERAFAMLGGGGQAQADRLTSLMKASSEGSGWTLAKLVLLSEAVREIVNSCQDRLQRR
ncbi:MAG: NAD-glutamate dehydrogenase [Alphaproteobacteria bacterium]|nr:NAD-glutamate dehydrogenase [Alphaproteobacteria bacterium]